MPKQMNNGTRVAAQLRRYRVLDMKVAGGTDRSIADAVGVSPAQVNKDIKRVLSESAKSNQRSADDLRELMMRRYERLFLTHWQGAVRGDPKSTELCLHILLAQRQINGLDAAVRLAGEDGGPIKVSIDELAKVLYANNEYRTEISPVIVESSTSEPVES
jgi:hypothetical protein